jgi:hypothetical protein
MCKWNKYGDTRIDPCMRKEIEKLKKKGIVTLACCCGHNKYPKTIVIKSSFNGMPFEKFTKQYLPRKKRFYKRDEQRVYFIPEVIEDEEEMCQDHAGARNISTRRSS